MRGTEAWKSVWPSLLGGALAAATLVWAAASDPFVSGLQMLLAQATNGLLRLLGQATTVVGTTVQSSQFGISVVTACTGLFATGLFVVAVAAFPTRWRAKLAGVALGVVCIFAINLVRLVSLYFVGVHWPQILDAVHLLIWQSLLIALAVALWSVWAGRVTVIRRRGAR
jgi:archaeosortase B (VPXXXP-CTERM-specific)